MDEILRAEFLKLNNYVLRFLFDVMFFIITTQSILMYLGK